MRKDLRLQRLIKRAFDVCAALIGLILLSPLMLIAACRIYGEAGRPLFFNSVRAGMGGRPFKLYKFRTMTNERDENGDLLPDAERLTPLGKKLRSTSIDELPQLLNVLKGDMSIVGPRPLPLEYVPRYSAEQKKRLDVPQGITGWAQIHGRNAISWEQKFAFDIWYVENRSIALDIKIIAATVKKVLAREGISAEGEATMPEFKGGGNDG
ncbi:MAG: sugar transferase [Synergistes sp.]|nr:sugar transferase [Synergistes sp.]